MTTKYTDAPRTRVMTPASLNNGVHENHSIGQTMAIAPKKGDWCRRELGHHRCVLAGLPPLYLC